MIGSIIVFSKHSFRFHPNSLYLENLLFCQTDVYYCHNLNATSIPLGISFHAGYCCHSQASQLVRLLIVFSPGRVHSPSVTMEARPSRGSSQARSSSIPLSFVSRVHMSSAIGTFLPLQSSKIEAIAIGQSSAKVLAYIILDLFLNQKLQRRFLLSSLVLVYLSLSCAQSILFHRNFLGCDY